MENLKKTGISTNCLINPKTNTDCFKKSVLIGLRQIHHSRKLTPSVKKSLENSSELYHDFEPYLDWSAIPENRETKMSEIRKFSKMNINIGIKILMVNNFGVKPRLREIFVSNKYQQNKHKIQLLGIKSGRFLHLCFINKVTTLLRTLGGVR